MPQRSEHERVAAVAARSTPPDAMELRLFIEELACDICRFRHATHDGVEPQAVRIRQEVQLASHDAFADIVVEAPGGVRYVVEVKYGYSLDRITESLARKFRHDLDWFASISRIILIVDSRTHPEPSRLEGHVRRLVPPRWAIEVWNDERLLAHVRTQFDVDVESLIDGRLHEVRAAIDRAKGLHAFGAAYDNSALDAALLWHMGYWRLRRCLQWAEGDKSRILQAGTCPAVAVVYADLSGFSGYVRDTHHDRTIQECLTGCCSKARYQIINDGGMLYQFQGDAVIGLFGIPDQSSGYVEQAFDCARALLMVGESISNEWQRQLDRIQPVRGSHIGIAVGELQLLSLRPFSRTHVGAIGDAINMAARLSAAAEPGVIVMSNLVYREFSPEARRTLRETDPVEAKNVGRIKAWAYDSKAQEPAR